MFGLSIKHNIEVAHRLSLLPGKCEAIHGHSMWVKLTVAGPSQLDENDLMAGLEFGAMKKAFRSYLDSEFDHHLLLNAADIWAQPVHLIGADGSDQQTSLPGLRVFDGDPTTENIAREIGKWARDEFGLNFMYAVEVDETHVNGAIWTG